MSKPSFHAVPIYLVPVAFTVAGALALNAQGVRVVTSPTPVPALVHVNTPTVVTMTATVAPNTALLQQSVTLNEVTQDGRLVSVIGRMYDDGTNGDAIAGDSVYTRQLVVNRASPAFLWYRATAAYQGSILRVQSPLSYLQVAGASCFYGINPGSVALPASGGSGTVSVAASPGCPWLATSNASWILVTSGASGTGNGSVLYSVEANASTTARTGTVSIANQTFSVTQAAKVCSYSIDPASKTYPASGGPGTLNVIAPPGCPWSASSNAPWISITSGASGAGSGLVAYGVDPNGQTSPRSGTLSVANLTFMVSQAGAAASTPVCSVSANPATVRSPGLSELAAELSIGCTNLPPAGVTADVVVTVNTNITSRVMPGASATEALLLLNAPATPIVGVNAFQGVLAGYGVMRFPNVSIVPAAGDTAMLRAVNLRVSPATNPEATAISAAVSISSATLVTVSNPIVIVAVVSGPVTASTSVAPFLPNLTGMNLTIRELFPTVFRSRTGAAVMIDPSAEAGYWGPSLSSDIGAADTGTRFRAVFSAFPGVNVYAPVYPVGSQAVQLVGADASGTGGGFMTGSALGGTHVLLTPFNGKIVATWEVRTADPAAIEQHSFNVMIEGASPSQLESILEKVTLAPVSTVDIGSVTAPIPRFLDAPLNLQRLAQFWRSNDSDHRESQEEFRARKCNADFLLY